MTQPHTGKPSTSGDPRGARHGKKSRGRDGRGRSADPGQRKGTGTAGRSSRKGGGKPRVTVDEKVAQLAGPLQKVLARLPQTQRRVLELRMGLADGHPHDLADTARELGLSLSETRDIEKRAFEHIREAVPLDHLHKLLES
jgi:DNA-directed RNA polymerase specialized sigma24 family protein